jgi:3-oxoacyl-[acyl-carrier protein] reductase
MKAVVWQGDKTVVVEAVRETEAKKKFLEEANITRYGEPEEVADLIGYLVSPAAKWLTGTSVRIDGGEVKGI